jgi:hypothetical protein
MSLIIPKQYLYSGAVMTVLLLVFLTYGVYSGITDREIIKVRVEQVLRNQSEIDAQQAQIDAQQTATLIQLQNISNNLVNVTNQALGTSNNVSGFISFIGSQFGESYLANENFQYGQANETAARQLVMIKLLNEINGRLNGTIP